MPDQPRESLPLRVLLVLAILAVLGYLAYGFDTVHDEPLQTEGVAVYSGVAEVMPEDESGFILHELRNQSFRVYGTPIPANRAFVVLKGRYHENGSIEVTDPETNFGWDPYWSYKKYGSLLALAVALAFLMKRYRFNWHRLYLEPREGQACRT